jgi:hypothetical protein
VRYDPLSVALVATSAGQLVAEDNEGMSQVLRTRVYLGTTCQSRSLTGEGTTDRPELKK